MPTKDPEKKKAQRKRWAEKNPEKLKEARKRWLEDNPRRAEKQREYHAAWRARNGVEARGPRPQCAELFREDPNDSRHGSTNGYTNLGCRCDRCRAAWATHVRERNAKKRAGL